jgi:hypothetical protein
VAAERSRLLRGWPSGLGPLTLARGVDQGVLGLATLVLAARYGPEDFAPLALLFLVNSFSIQVSDFGLGFRIMRCTPDERLDRAGLTRIRQANVGIAVVAVVAGALVGGDTGALLAASGVIWGTSAEAYVRKAGTLKRGEANRVVTAEIVGAALFAAGAVALWSTEAGALWLGLLFVGKHVVESAIAADGLSWFVAGGSPFGSRHEWFGQVLTYAVANLDFVAVALLLDPAALSIYLVGFRVAAALPSLLGLPLGQTAFVTLGELPRPEAQRAVTPLVRRAFALGIAGAVVGVVAAVVLPILMGSSWDGSGPVTALMAMATPWRLLLGVTVAIALVAKGQEAVVRWEAGRLVLTSVVVFAAATVDIEAVAAAVALSIIVAITAENEAACRLIGTERVRFLRPAAVAASALVGATAIALA